MKDLLSELKRRNVFRVAIAYIIAAWVVTQVAATVFPILEAPDWTVKVVLLLTVLGFPIALVIAWAYELTPDGIRRESDVERGASTAKQTGNKLDRSVIVANVNGGGPVIKLKTLNGDIQIRKSGN